VSNRSRSAVNLSKLDNTTTYLLKHPPLDGIIPSALRSSDAGAATSLINTRMYRYEVRIKVTDIADMVVPGIKQIDYLTTNSKLPMSSL
jgi:hypothetical protein